MISLIPVHHFELCVWGSDAMFFYLVAEVQQSDSANVQFAESAALPDRYGSVRNGVDGGSTIPAVGNVLQFCCFAGCRHKTAFSFSHRRSKKYLPIDYDHLSSIPI